jgi:hypothetical protein
MSIDAGAEQVGDAVLIHHATKIRLRSVALPTGRPGSSGNLPVVVSDPPERIRGMSKQDYANEAYDACASIPAGMVITYGDLAELVGRPTTHARTVATILGHRPNAGSSFDPCRGGW